MIVSYTGSKSPSPLLKFEKSGFQKWKLFYGEKLFLGISRKDCLAQLEIYIRRGK